MKTSKLKPALKIKSRKKLHKKLCKIFFYKKCDKILKEKRRKIKKERLIKLFELILLFFKFIIRFWTIFYKIFDIFRKKK